MAYPALHSWTPTRYEREATFNKRHAYRMTVEFHDGAWRASAYHVAPHGSMLILAPTLALDVLAATGLAERACKIDADTRDMGR